MDRRIDCLWNNLCTKKIPSSRSILNSYDTDFASKTNFLAIIDNVKKCLNTLGYRGLSIVCKIENNKSLALSKADSNSLIVYKRIRKIHIGKIPPEIRHSRLNGDYHERGYKNLHIPSELLALQIAWILRLPDNNY